MEVPWLNHPTFMPTGPVRKVFHVIPSDCSWDGDWELTADLVVEIQASGEEVLAVSRHLTVEEYGEGASVAERFRTC